MTSVDFIIKELKRIHSLFTTSNIRYEFNVSTKTHLIEVTPFEFYNSESYMNAELELEDKFDYDFPSENILFVSDESLSKISNPIFEIYSEQVGKIRADFYVLSDFVDFNDCCENDYHVAGENNYALAA